jgi:hypothetical protein
MEFSIKRKEKIRRVHEGFPFLPRVSRGDTGVSRLVI